VLEPALVAIQHPGGLTVGTNDDQVLNYSTTYPGNTVTLNGKEFSYCRGQIRTTSCSRAMGESIRLRQIDTSKSLLLNRGFQWINEMPLNR
jgi:hypothetical protein